MKKKIIIASVSFILILLFVLLLIIPQNIATNKIGFNSLRLGESIEEIQEFYPNAYVGSDILNEDVEDFDAVELPSSLANQLLASGTGKEFIPLYVERYVIVRNDDLTSEDVAGYKDLLDKKLKLNIATSDSYIYSLALLNFSYTLNNSNNLDDAFSLMKESYDEGNITFKALSDNLSEFTITTDYEASKLKASGKNITIILPAEGSYEEIWGMFVVRGELDTTKLEEIAYNNYFTLYNGLAKAPLSYITFKIDENVYADGMLTRVAKIRRNLFGTYKFSGANSDERAIILMFVISLMVVWAIFIGLRINDIKLRNSVITCLAMLVLWVVLRYLKAEMSNVTLSRYIWYLSYVPLIFAPALWLTANIIIAYPNKDNKKIFLPIFIISTLLLFLVMSNDLFQATFKLKNGEKDGYGFNFYVICIFCFVELVVSVILLIKSNIHRAPKWVLICSGLLILFIIAYIAMDFVGVQFVVEQDYTMVVSLCALAILELSLRAGLIQNCGRYGKLFNEMTFDMAISNNSEEIIYQTNDFSITSNGSARISKFPILNGSTIFLDDLSEIQNLKGELSKRTVTLERNTQTLLNEQKVMAEYYAVTAQNTIFNELDSDFFSINEEIKSITEKLTDDMDRMVAFPYLARIKFLVSYTKQKYNFILNSKLDDKMEVQTVALAINLISNDAKTLGVESGLLCSSMEMIPSKYGIVLLDIFYMMMENAIINKCDLFTNVDVRDGYIVMFGLYPENVSLSDAHLSAGITDLISSGIITKEIEPTDNMLKLIFKVRSDN